MACEVPKKMIKIRFRAVLVSPQTEFGLDGVISSDLFPFTSVVVYSDVFIASFEYQMAFPVKTRSSMSIGSERFAFLGRGFV